MLFHFSFLLVLISFFYWNRPKRKSNSTRFGLSQLAIEAVLLPPRKLWTLPYTLALVVLQPLVSLSFLVLPLSDVVDVDLSSVRLLGGGLHAL